MRAHLRYIAREGVTPDGQRGALFSKDMDIADGQAFGDRCATDRHQFRFIVSPEDAHELADLKDFTRQLMSQMERDLETPMEWVAVAHWDTDNPHIHIVVRGKDAGGADLIIAREYMTSGLRVRAGEIATEWLGPRTERELQRTVQREITAERWTSLDATIAAGAIGGRISISESRTERPDPHARAALRGRLATLERLGLASREGVTTWCLAPTFEPTLRALGERGDIIKAMHRALKGQQRELQWSAGATPAITGQVIAKGFADELNDRGYLIVDAVDGRAHYIPMGPRSDLKDFATGNLVHVQFQPKPRRADANIAARALDGWYRVEEHHASLAATHTDQESREIIAAHVRRLEALRRAGIVDRTADGTWRVPEDLVARASAYDRSHLKSPEVSIRSTLTLPQQTQAWGATWLDEELVRPSAARASTGFGAEVARALEAREHFLLGHGLASWHADRVVPSRNLLAQLRTRELENVAAQIAKRSGLLYRRTQDGVAASGTYRRALQLVSGRFALLDDAVGFTLVPWRPVIEQRLGQSMTALLRGDRISWHFGRERGMER